MKGGVFAGLTRSSAAATHKRMLGIGLVKKICGLFTGKKLLLLVVTGVIALSGFAFKGEGEASNKFDYDSEVSPDPIIFDAPWGTPRTTKESTGLKKLVHQIQSRSWGGVLRQLALSFGIAMVLGSLVRAFLRTTVTLLVVVGGALWFLHYRGMIEPFWQDYYGVADSTRVWVMGQFESIKTFWKGSLPSAAVAIAGFGYGLKK